MKILVVGKGGREHALITALDESDGDHELYAFPGSDAIFEFADPVPAKDLDSLIRFLRDEDIDLCVAGEESYLVTGDGLADLCEKHGIACWGPHKVSAQLEASKEFAKRFMVRHNIPTGGYTSTGDPEEARAAITSYPCVLKFDGLAAGKGVAICEDEETAHAFIDEVLVEKRFGEGDLLVEEFLTGPEISIFASVADGDYQILATARDYKRIGEGDEGLNTGGMGAVSSAELISDELLAEIEATSVAPTVQGLVTDGLPYRGFLYFGLMLTDDGPKMLEYNCRFGDPECQAVMPLIEGDFAAYLAAGAEGRIEPEHISLQELWSVCVILASAGYPESSRSGDLITGLDQLTESRVYHAGTKLSQDEAGFETNGGRVVAIVATGETREDAVATAHAEAAKVDFEGSQRRSDIGILHFEES